MHTANCLYCQDMPDLNCPVIDQKYVLDSAYGVYIAQEFCAIYRTHNQLQAIRSSNNEEFKLALRDCLDGPKNDNYHESWEYILNNCHVYLDGKYWQILQNQDVFLILLG